MASGLCGCALFRFQMAFHNRDTRIAELREMPRPVELLQELPADEASEELVHTSRQAVHEILAGRDPRVLVVVGPCSVYDEKATLEYAEKLVAEARNYGNSLLIMMRVYFEKPRTIVGWKGMINDPGLDESFEIGIGLRRARGLLLAINAMGLPAATEFLDPIVPQYVADLISWGAIGARTTESQVHRELASGLSCPVGFKNGTSGNVQIAVDAVKSACFRHHFLGSDHEGRVAVLATRGNEDCHLILRGGSQKPNYDAASVAESKRLLQKSGLPPVLMIDFSHANSNKDAERQKHVCSDVAGQLVAGERAIMGVMIESNLVGGRQEIGADMLYGQSITDACVDWSGTVEILRQLSEAVQAGRNLS